MATWIQSLSWTLIYSLGQGLVVYASLLLVLRLLPGASSHARHKMALSSLVLLLGWFAATWWQQYHILLAAGDNIVMPGAHGVATIYSFWPSVAAGQQQGVYSATSSIIGTLAPWLSAFYIIGLVLMLVRLSAGMQQLFSLRSKGLSTPDAPLANMLVSLQERVLVNRGVQLFLSARAQAPMVVGFFKPIILLPATLATQLSTEQLEAILLHELAHIRRYDYLLTILHTIIETVLFFNPFVWLTSSIARREMEHACDDLVLTHTHEPLSYATALAAIANQPVPAANLALAATGQPNHLFHRIQRIMEMKKNRFSYSRMVAAILLIAAIASSIAWLAPSPAPDRKGRAPKVAPTPPAPPVAAVPVADERALPAPKATTVKPPVPPAAPAAPHTVAPAAPAAPPAPPAPVEENALINRLIGDGLIDQVKGFMVEKSQDQLYINGTLQAPEISQKYLKGLRQGTMRVEVFPIYERINRHPDAGLMQLLFPIQFQSGCADYAPAAKPGC